MTARTERTGRRELRGRPAWLTLAIVTLAVVGLIVFIARANHAYAVHQQHIANCVIVTGYTWDHCARITN